MAGGAVLTGATEQFGKDQQAKKQKGKGKMGGKLKMAGKALKMYFGGGKAKGGKIKKKGVYVLHKGETVVKSKKTKTHRKHHPKHGMSKLGMSPPIKKTGLKRGKKKRQYGKR